MALDVYNLYLDIAFVLPMAYRNLEHELPGWPIIQYSEGEIRAVIESADFKAKTTCWIFYGGDYSSRVLCKAISHN